MRSQQQKKTDVFTPVKVESTPQLSSLPVQSEQIREFCIISQNLVNPVNKPQDAVKKETAASSISVWEENFQDLSSWCMANIQTRCDFPTGESVMASNLPDSTTEGSNVLISANATSGLMQVNAGKINNGVETFVGTYRSMPATCIILPQAECNNSLADHQQQKQTFFQNNNKTRSIINNLDNLKGSSNVWVDLPQKLNTGNANMVWQLNNMGIAAPSTEIPLYYQQSSINNIEESKQQPMQQRENQDVFQNLDNVASNGFDLLSYLCEDDISSLGDSITTDSSRDINATIKLSNSSPHTVVSPKTCEPVTSSITTFTGTLKSEREVGDSSCSKELSNPAIPSTSLKPTISSSSSAHQTRTVLKMENFDNLHVERRSMRPRRSQVNDNSSHSGSSRGTNKKRILSDETESDDDSYRDTREKNNEASRKSRMNKKAKEQDMAKRAIELEKDNRILKMKVEELEKLVSSMRNALLRSALKKEIKSDIF